MTLGAGKRNALFLVLPEHLLASQLPCLLVSKTEPSLVSRSCGLAGAGRWPLAYILRGMSSRRPGRDKADAGVTVGGAAVRLRWLWVGSGQPGLSWVNVPKARGAGLAQGLEASAGLDGAGGRDRSRPGPTGLPSRRPRSKRSHSGAVCKKAGVLPRRADRRFFDFFGPPFCTRSLPLR